MTARSRIPSRPRPLRLEGTALLIESEAAAVVLDLGDQPIRILPDRDFHTGRGRVLLGVMQSLLHDAIDAGLHAVGEIGRDAVLHEVAGDAAAAEKILQLKLERGDQA
jgi:hypothetical protein